MSYIKLKSIAEPILALLMLIVLMPLMLIISMIILFDSRGSVIFVQKRLGVGGDPFDFYKFRSMKENTEGQGSGVYSFKGDPRVTRFGAFIRRSSLDELPQLWNIVKGDMGFIGPRPVLVSHPWPYEEYTSSQKQRFDIRPGVTGLAQINGRKTLKWKDRIEFDIEYAKKVSFSLDCTILIRTVKMLFTNEGNYNTQRTDDKEGEE
jgi:lipopolysaccharide/colanic/teichoic acid biosynthesis glycosyltransferase